VYPISFGDLSTGLNLFVAMAFAVLKQRSTGLGSAVDTSLYASGIWAAMPHLLDGDAVTDETLPDSLPSTQSISDVASLPPAVREVVLEASSDVGDISWDAPFPFAFDGHTFDVRPAPMYGADQQMLSSPHVVPDRSALRTYPTTVVEVGSSPAIGCAGRMLSALGVEVR
jgi:hypothetical protein